VVYKSCWFGMFIFEDYFLQFFVIYKLLICSLEKFQLFLEDRLAFFRTDEKPNRNIFKVMEFYQAHFEEAT
jgi:hypothetical protein